MKKIISILLVIAMLCALLCACGKKNNNEPDDTGADVSENEEVEFDYSSYDYSAGLGDYGWFEGITALDYVTLPEIPVVIPTSVSTVSNEEIQDEVDAILENYVTNEQITDRAVADGDTLNIDYVGKVDGVEFEGGSTDGQGADVTIGVTKYIDDFLEQLIGHMPGETFDIEVTFPEVYQNADLQGKDAVFTVTINYIAGEEIKPELTDEFVAENFGKNNGVSTVIEMGEYIRKTIREQNVSTYVQNYIVDASEFKEIPEAVYEFQKNNMLASYSEYAEYYGMTVEDITGGLSLADILEQNKESIEAQAKFSLAVQALSESDPDLKVTEAAAKGFYLVNYGTEDYSQVTEVYGEPYLFYVVMNEYVIEYLLENIVYEDTSLNVTVTE
ncbi:MAG: FKBP-type peptidyl-prolyl cis-trans isomerase [Clostridia bacterium]|nr:FKBP-type peptidyl-prolyl cis-trans isomerase [Clostridia bacterium]